MLRRLALALFAGLAIWTSFPDIGFWPAGILGVALLSLATCGVNSRVGALLGLVAGLAYFVPTLSWSGIYLGAVPWGALSLLEALYIAALGAVTAALQRGRGGRADAVRPVAIALAWVVDEYARSTTPWGGFPWVRLGIGQADSPLAHISALAGIPGVTFVTALAGGLLAVAVRVAWRRRAGAWRGALLATVGALALTLGPAAIPLSVDGPTAQFLAVQGNVPKAGLDFNVERRAVLDNHARLTREAAAQVAAGTLPTPDIVVWPENSSDIDPLRNPDAQEVVAGAVRTIGVPTIVGAVLDEPDADHVTNASLLYDVDAQIVGRYAKRHPAPFAEYIPWRPFVRLFSDKVDLVSREFVAGTTLENFTVPRAGGGAVVLGPNICFEIVYDDLVRDGVLAGANVILVQTNNATFGFTAESTQQLAASKLRAIEHGRSVVHVSTVGVSAMITPDGVAHETTSLYTPALLHMALPLRTDLTLAARLGRWPEYVATALLLGAFAQVMSRRRALH